MPEVRTITKVSSSGQLLTLDDGSKWTIRGGDISRVAVWYETQHIVVNQDASGGYTLQNLDTSSKEEVKATRRS